ncbi:MAG: tetratricopeptide repeat protein [Gammaproteobacteria bacterium]|nr:tetratricopeptide repeat protein [Gammaproteobacteria bacterium]
MSTRTGGSNRGGSRRGGATGGAAALSATLRRAQSCYQAGRLAEAAAYCQEILGSAPGHFDALHLLAILVFQLGHPEEAARLIEQAVAINPRSEQAFMSRGIILQALYRYPDALASYDRAVALRPAFAEAWYRRGNVLHDLSRRDDALASYDRALAIKPDYVEALYNRGLILQEMMRHPEALASYERALALRPDIVDAHYNRGLILYELRRYDEALASYERALGLRPDMHEAISNRGNTLRRLNRYEEALLCFVQALRLKPDYVEALVNKGLVLQDLDRCEDALKSFEEAIRHSPGSPEAHCGAALCRLSLGDFAAGWEEYEWRWRNPQTKGLRHFPEPLWLGREPVAGRTLLLWAEQGFGDTIQFCRYAKNLAEAGARVILEVQPALKSLLSRLVGPAQVVAQGEALPAFEWHCPLLSLPLAFRTTLAGIPAPAGYITPDDAKARVWQAILADTRGLRVGLAWSGDPRHPNDHNRSLPLSGMHALLAVEATFIGVQKEVREADAAFLAAHPAILRPGERVADFADAAALIASLDLLITVDTSVAHLAGAMGKPVWILLPHNPDWRWLRGRDDSPWYPSARLFRQAAPGDWSGVIERLVENLRELAQSLRPAAGSP